MLIKPEKTKIWTIFSNLKEASAMRWVKIKNSELLTSNVNLAMWGRAWKAGRLFLLFFFIFILMLCFSFLCSVVNLAMWSRAWEAGRLFFVCFFYFDAMFFFSVFRFLVAFSSFVNPQHSDVIGVVLLTFLLTLSTFQTLLLCI